MHVQLWDMNTQSAASYYMQCYRMLHKSFCRGTVHVSSGSATYVRMYERISMHTKFLQSITHSTVYALMVFL